MMPYAPPFARPRLLARRGVMQSREKALEDRRRAPHAILYAGYSFRAWQRRERYKSAGFKECCISARRGIFRQ